LTKTNSTLTYGGFALRSRVRDCNFFNKSWVGTSGYTFCSVIDHEQNGVSVVSIKVGEGSSK